MSEPEKKNDHRPDNSKKSSQKKPERQPSNNTFIYLMIGIALSVFLFSIMNDASSGNKLKFSEFLVGLQEKDPNIKGSGRFDRTNVHELRIDKGFISFQDQPESKSKQAKSIKRYVINLDNNNISSKSQEILENILKEKEIAWSYPDNPSALQSLFYLLLPVFLLIIFFIFIFKRMGGAGSAMSFGRSRGKLFAQEDIGITFSDVAGIEEAVDELKEVVEFLKHPEKYLAIGARIPRGVLLVGPPGTGKTLLAKAVAGEAGVPFFSLSGSDFVEMFVGVGAARVRDMFQQAGQKSPSIIFIDELDALGKTRGSGMPGGHDEREQTLNALLVEMDGFSTEQSVIVMAATNRPETLDPALMRPGRFDRHVLVDRPDFKGREQILKVHAVKIKMDKNINLGHIAKITSGFVGADLANLVNEAALLAARNNKTCVTKIEFEEAVERVIAGLEKSTRIIHEDEKQRVAYHESGHALVACSLPNTDPVHKISIIPRGLGALGYMMQRPEEERQLHTETELFNRICVLLGGTITEEIVFKEISSGAQNDLQRATDIARRMVTEFGMSSSLGRVHYSESKRSPFLGDSGGHDYSHSEKTVREIDLEIKRMIDEASHSVFELLNSKREVLNRIATDLLEVEVMDSDHLKKILDEFKTGPQIKPGTHAALPEDKEESTSQHSEESSPEENSEEASG
jgi:cell division protease FtsH